MAGEKILIIDPSLDDVRPLVEGLLDPEGYIVVHALDGEEGLRQALHGNPNLIIAEFAAPRRSGLDVLTQLRKAKQEIPFILTGVSGSVETFRRALRMSVVDYLIKPLDLGEVRSAITRALAKQVTPAPAKKETGLLSQGFAQINRQLEKRVRELSILQGIGKAVASVLDLEKLLKRIVEAAVYLTGAEEGFLLLLDEETNELYMRAGLGLGKKFASGFRVKSEDSLPLQVIQTGRPVMISSVTDEEKFKLKTGFLVKALLHVPLKFRDEIIGVLSVDNKISRKSFSDNDLHLLSALADYAVIAIDNARLYKHAEVEAAKFAELLSAQESAPPPPFQSGDKEARGETISLDWVVQELETQKQKATNGLSGVEKLTKLLADQLSSVEQLARQWRDQRGQFEELAHRLSGSEVMVNGRGVGMPVVTSLHLQRLLNSLGEGLLITDPEGIVTLANEEASKMLGSEQVTGQNLRLANPSSHWIKSVDRLWNNGSLNKGTRQEITFWNNEQLIKANFVPLSEKEKIAGWVVVLRDMGQERAAQLTYKELTSLLSQQLRTPMTILTSYTDLLLAETVGLLVPVQQRLLQRMRVNLMSINETLNDLMEVPPMVRKQEQDSFHPVDLTTVIREALTDATPWLTEKKIHVDLRVADGLPRASAEPDCVYQMLTNLLHNAVRITPVGGTIEVQAETGQSNELLEPPPHLIISVRDQGGGIAPEFLSQVFERFYSDETQPIPGLGGKGAELSLVKTLVETFGGRVWVETEVDQGSTFSFVLPSINE